MARPLSDAARTKYLNIRVTEAEWREMDEWVGTRNRSEVLRRVIFEKIREESGT